MRYSNYCKFGKVWLAAVPALLALFITIAQAAPGDVELGFDPNVSASVLCTAVQPDGKILIGGIFSLVDGTNHNHLARLNADGSLDASFSPNVSDNVYTIAVQPDGKILIGGAFTQVNGTDRFYIARLNANGTLENSFTIGTEAPVHTIQVLSDGKILVSGQFTYLQGSFATERIGRLNPDSSFDSGFSASVNASILCSAVQDDGKIIVGGMFTNVSGFSHPYLARLNANGGVDNSFNAFMGGPSVLGVAIQPDGKVIAVGSFGNRLTRYDVNGATDNSWIYNIDARVWSVALQTDGKILMGGEFTAVNGFARHLIARYNADTSLDSAFNPGASGGADSVSYVGLQSDGKVLVGGGFNTVGGISRMNFARLTNNAATQSLTISSSNRVQWLRGGASPETHQVTFELSTNGGASYISLGSGTRISGGWERTGLTLPAVGQIRARARIVAGANNGGNGLTETILSYAPEINVQGNGVSIADGDNTPSTTDWTDFGTADFRSFAIANNGNGVLNISNVTITGANASDFNVFFFSPSLNPGYVGSLVIEFNPTAAGTRNATVNIANSDPDENPFNFAIRGTAPATPIINALSLVGNCLGSTAEMFVQASGANLTYQWQRSAPGSTNFVNMPSATNSVHFFGPVTMADDQTRFRVVVSSGAVSTNSTELLLAPIFIIAPSVVFDFSSSATNMTLFGDAAFSAGQGITLTPLNSGQSGAMRLPDLSPDSLVLGFTAIFQLRTERGNGYADGFSFNWASDLPDGVYSMAEEGAGSGLRVCFDWYDNGDGEGPAVDVKWGTNTIGSYHADNSLLPGFQDDFTQVAIRLNTDGTLDVNYRCTPIFSRLPIPGYAPLYHARFGMGARTGGTFSRHTVDDLALQLITSSSLLDATVPGGPIVASSTNFAATTPASKAIDNNVTSKYLNFDKLNTGITVTPIGQQPVRTLTLISAEDVPERDPSSFVLEGSNDGTNFTRVASNAVPAFPARNFIQSFPLPATNLFAQYRLRFPTISNSVIANSMQIAEIELLRYEELTSTNDTVSITLPPGAVDVRGVGMLFDRQLSLLRKLEVAPITNSNTVVNIIPASGAKVLKGFELIGAADDFAYPQRRPSMVSVAGSNDGVNYTNLATVVPVAPSFNSQIQEFTTTSNNTAYARYRITFGPPVSGDRIQVGEMRLFGESAAVNLPLPTLSILANGNNVLVRWPDNPGFVLETRTSVSSGTWTPVGNAPVLSNGTNTVTLPATQSASFFRLRK